MRCAIPGLAALLVSLALPHAAWADACGDKDTQLAMNECANDAFAEADAALNAVYGQVVSRSRTEPVVRQRLVAAEKTWITFRDGECAFEASLTEGGSIHPFIVARCLESLTRRRTEELRFFLRCQEGDLDCPVPPR